MFIDLGVTKLLDIREIRELHNQVVFNRLGTMETKRKHLRMLDTLEVIFRAFNPEAPRHLTKFIKEQNGHLSLVVALDGNVSINGTWKEEFSTHNQLHVSKELVSLSVSYMIPKVTIGLIVANSQARNPDYYSPNDIVAKLINTTPKITNPSKVHKLIPRVVGIFDQTSLNDKEAKILVEFIKEVSGFLTHLTKPLTPKTRLLNITSLKPTPAELSTWHLQVIKAYLMLAKHHGNYAILNTRFWN